MNDIIFSSLNEVDIFFDSLKYLGSGSEGSCYKKGNMVYKKYNQLYSNLYSNDVSIYRLLRYRDIVINNIYFIRKLMYFDNMVVGAVSNYASGISCSKKQLHRCKLDNIINALSILKRDIYELSKLGICIDDNFLGNILYDGDNFKLIDTGGYYYYSDIPGIGSNYDINFLYENNMRKIILQLFKNITDVGYIDDNFIYGFLWDIDSLYKDYLDDINLMVNPDKTIIGIRNDIGEYVGYEIDNFSQCRKDLLRIRKKI